MQIYDTDKDDNIIIIYDSRWQDPEVLGYEKGTKEYEGLRKLWENLNEKYDKGEVPL